MNDEVHGNDPLSILRYWQAIELLTPRMFNLLNRDKQTVPYAVRPTARLNRVEPYGAPAPWRPFAIDVRIVANRKVTGHSGTVKSQANTGNPLSAAECRKKAQELFEKTPALCIMRLNSHAAPVSLQHTGKPWCLYNAPSDRDDQDALNAIQKVLRRCGQTSQPFIIDDAVMDAIIERLNANGDDYAIVYHVERPLHPSVARNSGAAAGKTQHEYGFVLHTEQLGSSPYRNQYAERRALLEEHETSVTWFPHHSYQITIAIRQRPAFETLARILSPKSESQRVDADQMNVALREQAPDGYAACASISVRDDGVPLRKSLHLSQYARALSDLIIADRDGAPVPPESWPKAGNIESEHRPLDEWLQSARQNQSSDSDPDSTFRIVSSFIAALEHELGFDVVDTSNANRFDVSAHILENRIVSITYKCGTSASYTAADFMDSFYSQDLNDLVGIATADRPRLSRPMRQYLSSEHPKRRHIATGDTQTPDAGHPDGNITLFELLNPENIPQACWPGNPEHTASLHQQIAVNEILASFIQGGTQSLMGVNGPPGTGKTTLLRDVISAIITERAKVIAQFDNPSQLFEDYVQVRKGVKYWPVNKRVTGFEILVTSANNKAVENISLELPSEKAIHEYWRNHIINSFTPRTSSRYGGFAFGDTATAIAGMGNTQ